MHSRVSVLLVILLVRVSTQQYSQPQPPPQQPAPQQPTPQQPEPCEGSPQPPPPPPPPAPQQSEPCEETPQQPPPGKPGPQQPPPGKPGPQQPPPGKPGPQQPPPGNPKPEQPGSYGGTPQPPPGKPGPQPPPPPPAPQQSEPCEETPQQPPPGKPGPQQPPPGKPGPQQPPPGKPGSQQPPPGKPGPQQPPPGKPGPQQSPPGKPGPQQPPPENPAPQQAECSCIQPQPDNSFVQNAQPADKQNVGEKCHQPPECDPNYKYRYVDGRCNNPNHKTWGMPDNVIVRLMPPVYSTTPGDPPGTFRRSASDNTAQLKSPRVISRNFFTDHDFNSDSITLIFMVMSQLFTHDVLSMKLRNAPPNSCCIDGKTRIPPEKWNPGCMAIEIPSGDRFYKEFGLMCSETFRAMNSSDCGCPLPEPEQVNSVTSFFDGSVVYGTNKDIADQLRLMQDGKLKFEMTPDGRVFLPNMDQATDFYSAAPAGGGVQASDSRAIQHAHLAALQVVMLRVHNKLAEELKKINPGWQDEDLYQEAKKILTAMLQHSIYGRFAEIIFGADCAKAYGFVEGESDGYQSGYNPDINPATTAEFQHGAFRAFHTLVKGNVGLYDESRNKVGEFAFSDWYNNPTFIKQPNIFDQLLIGMCTEPTGNFDRFFSSEVTDKLFKQVHGGKFGSDLAGMDLIRGRECGLPPYVELATLAGYPMVENFDQLSDRMDAKMIERLKLSYADVRDIDAMIGLILEYPLEGSILGRTLNAIIAEQMRRYKFGDAFFYSFEGRGQFTEGQLKVIRKTSLSLLICWGSDGIQRIQQDAYTISSPDQLTDCKQLIDDFVKQLGENWKV